MTWPSHIPRLLVYLCVLGLAVKSDRYIPKLRLFISIQNSFETKAGSCIVLHSDKKTATNYLAQFCGSLAPK